VRPQKLLVTAVHLGLRPISCAFIGACTAVDPLDSGYRVQVSTPDRWRLIMQADALITWTDERVENLKKLWQEGLSASQIAGRLGGVTRNAVIGKVHRLGLAGRATTSRPKMHRPRRATAASTQKRIAAKPRFAQAGNTAFRALYQGDTETYTPAVEELVIPEKERKYITTLTENCCRWPIGDPQHADFHFCGKGKVTGLPYCEFHARRAFQPPQSRRRDMAQQALPPIVASEPAPEVVATAETQSA
jgi:GcrA cell cycle regulator